MALLFFCISPGRVSIAASSGNSTEPRESVKVEIRGVEGQLLDNVKGFLRILRKKDDPHFNRQWMLYLHRQAPADIRKALEPFGYFDVQVESSIKEIGRNNWVVTYEINTGPRAIIKGIEIKLAGQGAEEKQLLELADACPLKQGDYLDQDLYEKYKKSLLKKAMSLGYVHAAMPVARILVDPDKASARIKLHLDTGPRFYIGRIRFIQDFMDEGLLERYLGDDVKPGDVFSNAALLKLQQALSNTGYFDLVDVQPDFKNADNENHVPVNIRLSPAKRHRLSFGLGYDTAVGAKASMRWHNARVNSLGHSSDAWVKLSGASSSVNGAYWIPAEKPRTDRYGIVAGYEQEETDNTRRRTLKLEGGYYFLWRKWSSKLFVDSRYERFRTDAESWTGAKMLSLGGRIERSEFQSERFPRTGWYLFDQLQTSPGLISDTGYIRNEFKGRLFIPVGSRGRLFLRGRLGIAQVSDYDKYPTSLRFFAGGDESVRGYRWKELGPRNGDGDVIGGRNVLTGTVEYDHRVLDSWVAAFFADAGNAFNNSFDRIYIGTGLGVRWLSPVGSVRLDFAWPVNEDGRGMKLSSMKFYFGFEITM